jgi:hypothetical protein
MLDALSITWISIKDFWEEFVFLMLLNIVWFLAAVLPIVPTLAFGSAQPTLALILGLVLALPLPIVSGGICFVTNQVTRGTGVSWATFARGVHRYWAKSLIVALINVVGLLLLATNLHFYAIVLQGAWTNFALSIWLVLSGYWLLVQVFWFPTLLELKSEKVLPALRNALLMPIASPGFALVLSLVMVLIIVLSILLTVPALLLTIVLLMLMANHATRSRLARAQKRPYKPGPPEE